LYTKATTRAGDRPRPLVARRHVNSVTYHVPRATDFESSPGLDLEQSEARLLAQVALKILNGVGA
jgi:hypothetical protein